MADRLPVGWKAIFERQNAPRPSNEATPSKYVTIFVSPLLKPNLRDFALPLVESAPDVFDVELVGDREFTVNLQAFGVGALQILEDLRAALDIDSAMEELREEAIAVIQALGITDLTGLYDSQFLERGNLDIRFRTHASTVDADVSYIGEVQVEATIEHPPAPDIVQAFTVDSTP